jgi:hypothetical protein
MTETNRQVGQGREGESIPASSETYPESAASDAADWAAHLPASSQHPPGSSAWCCLEAKRIII